MSVKEKPKEIFLKDYQKTPYLIPKIDLEFRLNDLHTQVKSTLHVQSREAGVENGPLTLNGENLKLIDLQMDGIALNEKDYELTKTHLSLHPQKHEFKLEITTEINPAANKALEGLYLSNHIFCTQNESEGFRKITYFYDRPDVLSTYTTKVIANKENYPVLLANGNLKETGDLPEGNHFALWEDPFPKPCYLFALVAGDLAMIQDQFITMSGRTLDLRIYVEHGQEDQCDHAMASLKNAMKWDEERFGRECDLDMYMIVAVNNFNFGAMENKGLNIFNSQYVLANPQIATDANYDAIEGVIGHEYFHNWTGNRITCRDWFQITLKEGLTVFRDQEFSSDMGSRPVKRIEDARIVREYQFLEDAGPNAHPIRPQSYIEINNFYTTTVYQKGAEVIRMIHTLIGKENFRKGMDHYFKTYDGQAVTTEEFVQSMEAGSSRDLKQFRNWYDQVGTPKLKISSHFNTDNKSYTVTVKQESFSNNSPLHIPIATGLIDQEGKEISSKVLELTKEEESFVFENITAKPTPSFLRDFSAPVYLDYNYTEEELIFLFSHDPNSFNRYDAGQRLSLNCLEEGIKQVLAGQELNYSNRVLKAYETVLTDQNLDGQYKSYALSIPSLSLLTSRMQTCDFESADNARKAFTLQFAKTSEKHFYTEYQRMAQLAEKSKDRHEQAASRAFQNTSLHYLQRANEQKYIPLAYEQFKQAKNMTLEIGALSALSLNSSPEYKKALEEFCEKWSKNSLVINKWFQVQASSPTENLIAHLKELEKHPLFDKKNPNKIRSIYGVFCQNLVQFHQPSGEGYAWIASTIIEIDKYNPKAAASLATQFRQYAKLQEKSKALAKRELERILSEPKLSSDTYEIVSKTLKM